MKNHLCRRMYIVPKIIRTYHRIATTFRLIYFFDNVLNCKYDVYKTAYNKKRLQQKTAYNKKRPLLLIISTLCILFILDTNIVVRSYFSRTVLDFDLRQFGELYLIKFHNVFTVLA